MTIYEQILAGLQTKFQGVDSATLTRIATSKATGITDEAQVKTIVDGVSFTDVMSSYADFRANEATRTSVANYEKKHNLKDGKPVEEKEDQPKPTSPDGEKADVATLIQESVAAALKPVTDKLSALENEKSASEFSVRVSEAAKKYGISEKVVSRLNVPQDADLDKFMQDTKQDLIDTGFKEVRTPESAEQQTRTESDSFAKAISDETQKIVEQQKK